MCHEGNKYLILSTPSWESILETSPKKKCFVRSAARRQTVEHSDQRQYCSLASKRWDQKPWFGQASRSQQILDLTIVPA